MEIWILIVVSIVAVVILGDIRREMSSQSMKLSILETQLDRLPEGIASHIDAALSLQTILPDKIARSIANSDIAGEIGKQVQRELMVYNKLSTEIGKSVASELQDLQRCLDDISNGVSEISNRR
jgi:hypothetical protein